MVRIRAQNAALHRCYTILNILKILLDLVFKTTASRKTRGKLL